MSRPARLLAAGLILIGGALAPRALAETGPKSTGQQGSTQNPPQIKHIIVVLQSDHSFDNYFGTRPGVDGIPEGVCEPINPGSKSCVKPFALTGSQSRAGLNDSAHSMNKAIDGGKMDGFVSAQHNAATGTTAMGYYDSSSLSYYWALADHYTLFDHFFAAVPGGSLANRLFAIAGQDGSAADGTLPTAGFDLPTIFDELQKGGLSWKFYAQNYQAGSSPDVGTENRVPLLSIPRLSSNPTDASRIVDTEQYYQDLQNGELPAVSYVASSVDSERPPQNPDRGEAFVRSLLDALMQSSAWKSTAVILTYDNAGGWYDHVAPPTVKPSAPGLPLSGTAQQLGVRVPALLISPYSRPRTVVHQPMDTTSILRFVEQNWDLPPLTARDATAASIADGLDLRQAPIPARILSTQSPAAGLIRPHVMIIYGLYLGAAGAVLALVVSAIRSERRRPVSPLADVSLVQRIRS